MREIVREFIWHPATDNYVCVYAGRLSALLSRTPDCTVDRIENSPHLNPLPEGEETV